MTADAYRVLMAGEIIGVLIGGGTILGCAGANPYIALTLVLGGLVLHLGARRGIRHGGVAGGEQ